MTGPRIRDTARLRWADPSGERRQVLLTGEVTRLAVGRSERADLRLPDAEVSALHAVVERWGGHWTVFDYGLSHNGTFVNGEQLTVRHCLRNGDKIRIGNTVLAFYGGAEETTTRSTGGLPSRRDLTAHQYEILVALCRPYKHGARFATPATNQQIASEVYLSVDAVKSQLHELFLLFGIGAAETPNRKRAQLADRVMRGGIITRLDL